MPTENKKVTTAAALDDFDESYADRVVELIANGSEQLNLSSADIEWGTRMLWTLGQVAPVVTAVQHDAYAKQVADILAKAGAPISREVLGAFLRTQEGALATALMTRMTEWKRTGH